MKILLLTAIIAAVSSSPLSTKSWPWQLDNEYTYDVKSFTTTKFEESSSNGNSFEAQLVIRVKGPGQLLAKLINPKYASVPAHSSNDVPTDLKYQPVAELEQPFEIMLDEGRIESINVPKALPVSLENLLKGLVSAIQVDLSSRHLRLDFPNSFDKERFQGVFKKMEADVTGTCETLYSVSPISAEWRRQLPSFVKDDVVEIVKSKNYGSCEKPFVYHTGVPEGAVIEGIAYSNEEKQLIKYTSESRILAGKQGTIYRSEVLSSAYVSPLMFGNQKAEVKSSVKLFLTSVQQKSKEEWKVPEEYRLVDTMYFTVTKDFYSPVDALNVERALKVLQEIAPLLKTPNKLPKSDFLSKFNVLVRLVITLTPEQLTTMTKSVETASSKYMWIVYRDAVTQAGTHACFREIKNWIMTKKIKEEEAAQAITSVAGVIRWRTDDIAKEFYDLAFSPVVMEQKSLNTSALLAITKFINLKEDYETAKKIMQNLSEDLKKAVNDGDSSKAQVYVKVLGNLAYHDILNVFEPYFDGRTVVSKYLRTQMVLSLKNLANLKDERVRATLFAILRNTAEPYEVRVAAVLNIFMAFPTAEMMQIMAHMTNDDPSTQVRAAITNGINYAAKLKDPRFTELAKTAQAVQDIVNKEKFGYRLSTETLIDSYSSEEETGQFREMSYIGSKDGALPLYHRTALRLRNNGFTEEDWITFSVSDMKQLLNYVINAFVGQENKDVDFKFSAKKIIEELKLKREPQTPLEGSVFMSQLNQEKLITFSEDELNAFLASAVNNMRDLMSGEGAETQYIKIQYTKQVFVTFPLAMGMPFVYTYSEPVVFILEGKAKFKLGYEKTSTLHKAIHFTYARNMDGNAGFIDPTTNSLVSSGIINKLQFYIPANIHTKLKARSIKLNFVLPENDVNVLHMSVWPYTSVQKHSDVLAVLEHPSTKLIARSNKVISTNFNLGQMSGVGLFLQGYSYSSDYKKLYNLDSDLVTEIRHMLYQKDVALTEFDLKYVAKETKNKDVAFSFTYDVMNDLKESGEIGPAALMKDTEANSQNRREEMAKRVASGINFARVQMIDLAVVFDGEQKKEYVFTGALANSYVDRKSQFLIFYNGNQQFNAVIKINKPKIVPLNFEEAMKNEIKATYEYDIKFGNDDNINIMSVGERSKEFSERIMNDPMAKQCLQDTSKNNFYQMDCHKVILKAHAPDYFKTTVTYKKISPANLEMIMTIYDELKNKYLIDEEENILETTEDGKLEMISQEYYYDEYMVFMIKSKCGMVKLEVAGLMYHVYGMAFYPVTSYWERAENYYTHNQYMPYCAVDSNKVWTFGGRSYKYSLTSSWHVVMVDNSTKFGEQNDLVILARRPSENQEEVYVSYKSADQFVELDIKPSSVDVKTNMKKTSEGAVTSYTDEEKVPFLEYFNLSDNVMVFYIDNAAIRIMYDKERLVIFTDDHRATTNGLCGKSTGEFRDDYMTPMGLVDSPDYYGASFSLEGEFSDPKTVELKKEAKEFAYQPVTKYTYIGFQPEW